MAEQKEKFLAPPVLAAIRNEENAARVKMERTASQEIREERADLKEAAEQTTNVIIDLGLDGKVRWVSPSWKDVIGTASETILGQPLANILEDQDSNPFLDAVESMKQDDSRSQTIRFRTRVGSESIFNEEPDSTRGPLGEGDAEGSIGADENTNVIILEGQGIMVYDRATGGESHVSRSMVLYLNSCLRNSVNVDAPSGPRTTRDHH